MWVWGRGSALGCQAYATGMGVCGPRLCHHGKLERNPSSQLFPFSLLHFTQDTLQGCLSRMPVGPPPSPTLMLRLMNWRLKGGVGGSPFPAAPRLLPLPFLAQPRAALRK